MTESIGKFVEEETGMNETSAKSIREKLDYLNETQDFNPTNIDWLMRQAARAQGMERLLNLASQQVDSMQENKKLREALRVALDEITDYNGLYEAIEKILIPEGREEIKKGEH